MKVYLSPTLGCRLVGGWSPAAQTRPSKGSTCQKCRPEMRKEIVTVNGVMFYNQLSFLETSTFLASSLGCGFIWKSFSKSETNIKGYTSTLGAEPKRSRRTRPSWVEVLFKI
jgi:hypothetical protein